MESSSPYSLAALRRLDIAARLDREAFFAHHARWRRCYGNRVEAVVLAEGGRRQVSGGRVAPLEVWTFFRHHPDGPFPTRRRRVPITKNPWRKILADPLLAGRPVTLVSVSLEADRFDDAGEVVRRYLVAGRARGATKLANGRIVLLDPAPGRGTLVWQPTGVEDAIGVP